MHRSFVMTVILFALGLITGIAGFTVYIRNDLLCSVVVSFMLSTGLFVIPATLIFGAWLWFRLRRQSTRLAMSRLYIVFLLGLVHVAILFLVQTQILPRLSYSPVSRCAEWLTPAFAYCTIFYAEIMRRYGFRAEPSSEII
jgi:membrane protease YdiL (CAAX protease family)